MLDWLSCWHLGIAAQFPESDLVDPDRDPDELATIANSAYRDHVDSYLSTTQPPCDTETAVSSGLLGSSLLGDHSMCS